MIDLYTWTTPNGRKISIALEELGLSYEVHAVNLGQDEQHRPEFVAISPSAKIPAIVDRESGVRMMESGAILLYLADKAGSLVPTDPSRRREMMEWLMYQMGQVGPMLGQAHHFLKYHPGVCEYAEQRYHREAEKVYETLDRRFADHEFLADEYSIADIATWPWISRFEWHRIDMNRYPQVVRWYTAIAARPAVRRGYGVPDPALTVPKP
jgi:GST-like protein